MRPQFEPADVVFEEWFASGASLKNIFTRFGGARNCLRLVVTRSFIWVTSWYPFLLFTQFYDLEHVIPLYAIVSVRPSRFLGRTTFLITYRDAGGNEHRLSLAPIRSKAFIESLGVKCE